jgi:hypothetical protein
MNRLVSVCAIASVLLFSCGNETVNEDSTPDYRAEAGTEFDDIELRSTNDRVAYSIGFTSAAEMREFFYSEKYGAYFDRTEARKGFYEGIQSGDTVQADICDGRLAQYFGTPGTFDTTAISVKEASHCMGFLRGIELKYSLSRRGLFDGLSTTIIKKGFKDGFYSYDTLITPMEQAQIITEFFGSIIKKEGEDFLEQNKQRKEVRTMDNGLQIETLKEGKGGQPTLNSTVSVYYTLSMVNGQVIESNADQPEPVSFPLSNVIQGWQQGLQLMKKGGKYKLFVPYELGYGHQGTQGIQPYSALVFEIELVDFK